jgi:hypothetical protein
MYEDNDNSNKVSSLAKARRLVTQGSVLGSLLFLVLINALSKTINKTSADDSSILFVHSNLIDFNNIHIIFETLNERFKANQLYFKY